MIHAVITLMAGLAMVALVAMMAALAAWRDVRRLLKLAVSESEPSGRVLSLEAYRERQANRSGGPTPA